MILVVNESLGN